MVLGRSINATSQSIDRAKSPVRMTHRHTHATPTQANVECTTGTNNSTINVDMAHEVITSIP